jgi:16S rRNA (guanine966-N2)-methyltransferase
MRIIGGDLGGRRFNPPAKNWPTRPTTDYAKESLYNILSHQLDFESMRMLDLFGGTGSHCYECISRGCTDATYVDAFDAAVRYARQTSKDLKIDDYLTVIKSDVIKYIQSRPQAFTFIFADPPYDWAKVGMLPDLILDSEVLELGGLFVMEHEKKHDFSAHTACVDVRKYGATILTFFERK